MYLPANNSCSYSPDRRLPPRGDYNVTVKLQLPASKSLNSGFRNKLGLRHIEQMKTTAMVSLTECENMLPSSTFPPMPPPPPRVSCGSVQACSMRTQPFATLWTVHVHFVSRMPEIIGWGQRVVMWSEFPWISVLLLLLSIIWSPNNLFSSSWLSRWA